MSVYDTLSADPAALMNRDAQRAVFNTINNTYSADDVDDVLYFKNAEAIARERDRVHREEAERMAAAGTLKRMNNGEYLDRDNRTVYKDGMFTDAYREEFEDYNRAKELGFDRKSYRTATEFLETDGRLKNLRAQQEQFRRVGLSAQADALDEERTALETENAKRAEALGANFGKLEDLATGRKTTFEKILNNTGLSRIGKWTSDLFSSDGLDRTLDPAKAGESVKPLDSFGSMPTEERGMWENFKDVFRRGNIPLYGSFMEIGDSSKLADAAQRLQLGEDYYRAAFRKQMPNAPAEEIEYLASNAYRNDQNRVIGWNNKRLEEERRGNSWFGGITKGVGDSTAFMADLAASALLTGGLASLAKAGGKGAAYVAGKTSAKMAERMAAQAAKKTAQKAAEKAAQKTALQLAHEAMKESGKNAAVKAARKKLLKQAGKEALKTAGKQQLLWAPQAVASGVAGGLERYADEAVSVDHKGNVGFDSGVSIGDKLASGIADAAIENLSESSGELIGLAVPRWAQKLPGKIAGKTFLRILNRAGAKKLEKTFRKMSGFNGTLSEMAEERVGDVLRGTIGLNSNKDIEDRIRQEWPTWRELGQEFISFLEQNGGMRVSASAVDLLAKRLHKEVTQTAQEAAKQRKQDESAGAEQEQPVPAQEEQKPEELPVQDQTEQTEQTVRQEERKPEEITEAGHADQIQWIPVSSLNIDPKRFQFKSKADMVSGVDESNKIGGKFDHKTAGNLLVWEDKEGKRFVVNGHHRFRLAKDSGVENVNAIIEREADGVTAEEARKHGVLTNIRDEQGDIQDYAEFVRSENMDEATAEAEGLLSRSKGRKGFLIGKYASDNLFSQVRDGSFPTGSAAVIADIARKDEAIEAAGIRSAKTMSDIQLREFLKLLKNTPHESNAESDLFGFDDSAIRKAEQLSRLAAKHIRETGERVRVAKNAVRNPETAGKMDVKVGQNAEKMLAAAQLEQKRWENWHTDPELYHQLEEELARKESKPVASDAVDPVNQALKRKYGDSVSIRVAEPANKAQKAVKDFFRKEFDTDVEFFDTDTLKADGFRYDGKIYLNRSGKKPMMFSAFHEFTHLMRVNSPELFRKLLSAVMALSGKRELSEWKKNYNAKYRAAGYSELDDGALEEEFIADVVGGMGGNAEFLKRLAGENESILKRFLEWIRNLRSQLAEKGYGEDVRKVIGKQLDNAAREVEYALKRRMTEKPDTKTSAKVESKAEADRSDRVEQEQPEKQNNTEEKKQPEVLTSGFVSRYMKRFGNVLSSDNIKLMFRDDGYDPHDEESIRDFHKRTGPLVGKMFDLFLRERKGKGNRTVVFTGGGNGSGKSMFLNGDLARNADFVMDSAMVNLSAAQDSIQKVLDNGQVPFLAFVYRAPADAWFNGVMKRNQIADGHTVPKSTFANTHSKARENFLKLVEEFGGKVKYIIRDNSSNGKEISLDELKKKPTYTKEQILEVINGKAASDGEGTGGLQESAQRVGGEGTAQSGDTLAEGRSEGGENKDGRPQRASETAPEGVHGRGVGQNSVLKELAGSIHSISDYYRLVMRNPEANASAKKLLLKRYAMDQKIPLKEAEEQLEFFCVQQARTIAQDKSLTEREQFNLILTIYNDMPLLNGRTSTSMENQAYSTPVPLAYMLGRAIGLQNADRVYEPTAGNGALVLTARPDAVTANEIEKTRLAALNSSGFRKVTSNDATEYVPEEKQDAVIANPPFGRLESRVDVDGFRIAKLEHLISLKALESLKADGRAALILGAADKLAPRVNSNEKPFLNYIYDHFNIADSFEVAGDLYKKQGAAYPVRVIILNGRKENSDLSEEFAQKPVERLDNWNDIYKRLKGVEDETGRRRLHDEVRGGVGEVNNVSDVAGTEVSGDVPGSERQTDLDDQPTGETVHRGQRSGADEASDGVGAGAVSGASARGVGVQHILGGRSRESDKPAERTAGSGGTSGTAGENESGRTGESGSVRSDRGNDAVTQKPEQSKGKTAEVSDDGLQNKYEPKSKAESLGTMIPKFMRDETEKALARLEEKYGPVDEFVRAELGYSSLDELYRGLAAEQIDSVALAINNIRNGESIIIGDQTGIGKGRQAAAVMRYAKRNGILPVFITEKPKLFSDLYLDGLDIGEQFHPLLVGNPEESDIVNRDNKVVQKALSAEKQKSALAGLSVGEKNGYDSVFITYSQLNKAGNDQQRLLRNLVGGNDVMLVMDEAHNASGSESNTGLYFQGMIKSERLKGAVFLSATYAKRPDNMVLFSLRNKLGKVFSREQIVKVIKEGGLALQQVISRGLAEAGQLIRRERDFSGVTMNMKPVRTSADVKRQYDEVAGFMSEFVQFSDVLEEEFKSEGKKAGRKAESALKVNHFSSVVHNYVGQLLFATKLDAAAEQIIAAYKAGQKPVIALSNTLESFLNEYAQKNTLEAGDRIDVTFRDILLNALERMKIGRMEERSGKKTDVPLTLKGESQILYERLRERINELDLELPASPIDYLKAKLTAAGMRVGELTGRTLTIKYDANGENGVLAVRDKSGRNKTVNDFNSGALDAIILNRSGSTGLSLHSSERHKDRKQRHMFIVQADLDINVVMQTLGRVMRSGQVNKPEYTFLSTDLEAERRVMSILQKKFASLSANTTANTKGSMSFGGTDLLNKYGDRVVAEYLTENPVITGRVGLKVELNSNGRIKPKEDLARSFTGKMALLPNVMQKRIYQDLDELYAEYVSRMRSIGEYDLEITEQEWNAEEVKSEQYAPGEENGSIFDKPLMLKTFRTREKRRVPDRAALAADRKQQFGGTDIDVMRDELKRKFAEQRKKVGPYFAEQMANAKERSEVLTREREAIATLNRAESLALNLLGYPVVIRGGDSAYRGTLSYVRFARTGNPGAESNIKFSFLTESPLRMTMPLSQIGSKSGQIAVEHTSDTLDEIFTDSPNRIVEMERRVYVGNLLRGVDAAEGNGKIVKFTLADGGTETGVVLPSAFSMDSLKRDPRRKLNDLEEVERYLNAGNYRTFATGDYGLVLYKDRIETDAKRASGGKIFLDEQIRDIVGDFRKYGTIMRAYINDEQFRQLVPLLLQKTQLSGNLELMNKLRENSGDVKLDISDGSDRSDRSDYPRNRMADAEMPVNVVGIESGKHYTLSQAENTLKKKISETKSKTGQNYLEAQNEKTGIIARITNRRVGKYVSEKAYNKSSVKPYIHAAAVVNIERLFRDASLGVSHPNHKGISEHEDPIRQIHRFYTGMRYEDHVYGVKLTVKELREGFNILYTVETGDIEVFEIKNPSQSFNREGGWSGSDSEPDSRSLDVTGKPVRRPNLKFRDFFEKFKPLNDLHGTAYSISHNSGEVKGGSEEIPSSGDVKLDIQDITRTFNAELERQMRGELPSDHIYQLGRPSEILRRTGIPNLNLELSASRLKQKAESEKHPFSISDIRDLPHALQNPVAIFAYGDSRKAQNIVVDIQNNGNDFLVGLTLNYNHNGINVNSIRGLFPKDTANWLNWIQQGKALYLDKEKVQNRIAQQRTNPADVSHLDLNFIENIVQDFRNVKENPEEIPLSIQSPDISDALKKGLGWFSNLSEFHKKADENGKTDISKFSTLFGTVMHYSRKIPAFKRIFDHAQQYEEDVFLLKEQVFGENEKDLKRVTGLEKDKAQYARFKKYIFQRDLDAKGFSVKEDSRKKGEFVIFNPAGYEVGRAYDEDAAWESAWKKEADSLMKSGESPEFADAVLAYRQMNARVYAMLKRKADELKAEYEENGIPFDGEMTDLFEELRKMGDRRGYYMARIRHGQYILEAEKDGVNPRVEIFDTKLGRAARAATLKEQGYKIHFRHTATPSNATFEDMSLTGMNDIFTSALERVAEQAKTDYKGFGLDADWTDYVKKDGETEEHFVIRGKTTPDQVKLFKEFGGGFWKEMKEWRFPASKCGYDIDKVLLNALNAESPQVKAAVALGNAFASQVSVLIHSHGSRSRKIRRDDRKGKDVYLGYEEDPVRALAMSASAVASGTAKSVMARNMMEAFTGRDLKLRNFMAANMPEGLEPGSRDYHAAYARVLKEYEKEVDRRRIDSAKQPEAYRDAKEYIREMLRNQEPSERIVGFIRGLAALKYLSRISTGLVNLGTLATNVPAVFHADAKVSFADGLKQLGIAATRYGNYLMYKKYGKGSRPGTEDVWLFGEIERRGWDSSLVNREATGVLRTWFGKKWKWISEKMMFSMELTERFNRAVTIAAGYRLLVAKHGGPLSGQEKSAYLEQAKEMSDKAHGVYGKTNLPSWARGSSAGAQALRSFYVFKPYGHNYMQELYNLGVNQKDRKAFAWMLLSPMILAGPSATLAWNLMPVAVRAVCAVFGIEPPDDPEEALYRWVEEEFGGTASRIARYGAGGAAGINLAPSMSMMFTQDSIPKNVWDLFGAPGSAVKDLAEGAGSMARGDVLKGLEKLSPAMIAAPLKAVREYSEGVTMENNQPVFYGDRPLKATGSQSLLRMVGFNPAGLSEKRDRQWSERLTAREYSDVRTEIYARLRRYYRNPARSAEEYAGLVNMIREYNARVRRNRPHGVTLITSRQLKTLRRRLVTPPKAERMRKGNQR